MKSFAIPVVLVLSAMTAAVVASRILFSAPPSLPQPHASDPFPPASRPQSGSLSSGLEGPGNQKLSSQPPTSSVSAETSKNGILEDIQEAASTYNPAQLPQIEPFLSHSDPEIRQAAREGVVLLGDAAGAKMLRDAASRTTDPTEVLELREMADYLDLPPLPVEGIVAELKARKAAKAAAASPPR